MLIKVESGNAGEVCICVPQDFVLPAKLGSEAAFFVPNQEIPKLALDLLKARLEIDVLVPPMECAAIKEAIRSLSFLL